MARLCESPKDDVSELLLQLPSNAFGPRSWRIEGELGRGAYGDVVAVTHWPSRALLAVKTVALPRFVGLGVNEENDQAGYEREEKHMEYARREFHSICRLSHPNVILGISAVFGRWEKCASAMPGRQARGPRCLFMITEVCPGGTLDKAAANMVARDGGTALSCSGRGRLDLHKWGTQIARALNYLHDNGLVHDDIKPSNLLLSSAGDVKVADLGFSTDLFDLDSPVGRVIGHTPAYAPPVRDAEYWHGELKDGISREEARKRKDVYAWGVTMLQLSGSHPSLPRFDMCQISDARGQSQEIYMSSAQSLKHEERGFDAVDVFTLQVVSEELGRAAASDASKASPIEVLIAAALNFRVEKRLESPHLLAALASHTPDTLFVYEEATLATSLIRNDGTQAPYETPMSCIPQAYPALPLPTKLLCNLLRGTPVMAVLGIAFWQLADTWQQLRDGQESQGETLGPEEIQVAFIVIVAGFICSAMAGILVSGTLIIGWIQGRFLRAGLMLGVSAILIVVANVMLNHGWTLISAVTFAYAGSQVFRILVGIFDPLDDDILRKEDHELTSTLSRALLGTIASILPSPLLPILLVALVVQLALLLAGVLFFIQPLDKPAPSILRLMAYIPFLYILATPRYILHFSAVRALSDKHLVQVPRPLSSLLHDVAAKLNSIFVASLLAFQQSFWSFLESIAMAVGGVTFVLGDCLLSPLLPGSTGIHKDDKTGEGGGEGDDDNDKDDRPAGEGENSAGDGVGQQQGQQRQQRQQGQEQQQQQQQQRTAALAHGGASEGGFCDFLSGALGVAIGGVSLIVCFIWIVCRNMSVWCSKFYTTYMAIDPAGSGGWATRLGGKGVEGRMLDQVYRGLGIHGEGLFGTMKRMRKDADMAQLGQAHMSAFKVLSFANKGSPSANLSNSCVAIGCACALVADTITANPSAAVYSYVVGFVASKTASEVADASLLFHWGALVSGNVPDPKISRAFAEKFECMSRKYERMEGNLRRARRRVLPTAPLPEQHSMGQDDGSGGRASAGAGRGDQGEASASKTSGGGLGWVGDSWATPGEGIGMSGGGLFSSTAHHSDLMYPGCYAPPPHARGTSRPGTEGRPFADASAPPRAEASSRYRYESGAGADTGTGNGNDGGTFAGASAPPPRHATDSQVPSEGGSKDASEQGKV